MTCSKVMTTAYCEVGMDEEDEVLYCTGSVTEAEVQAFKHRISNGMTTADDVVLLERILYEGFTGKAGVQERT